MHAKLGIAPIAWSNDDLPQLGGDTPLETCLSEAREAGFAGVELGGKFPRETDALNAVLSAHDLTLCSGWYSGTLLDNDLEAEKDQVRAQLDLFIGVNSPCLVYGETAGTIQNIQSRPLATRRVLDDDQIRDYGKKLTAFAEFCAEEGMPIAHHHHMGTAIETHHEVDALMNATGDAVGLLFDPGHLAFAGGDPLKMVADHGKRIRHVHTKDVRMPIINDLDRASESFLDAVLKGAFTVPGDGALNFDAIVQALADQAYEGWFVVEAEQDPAKANPLEYAKIGYAALTTALDKAGYSYGGKAA